MTAVIVNVTFIIFLIFFLGLALWAWRRSNYSLEHYGHENWMAFFAVIGAFLMALLDVVGLLVLIFGWDNNNVSFTLKIFILVLEFLLGYLIWFFAACCRVTDNLL